MKEELKKYINEHMAISKKKAFYRIAYNACSKEQYFDNNVDEYIKSNKNSSNFQTLLFKYIDERNLKDSDVYNKVNIDRRLFSKIRTDNSYHPSNETVILLGLALKLNETEFEKLLESASYSLPKNNYFDLIIRFCFINKIYKLYDVNNLLMDYDCKILNY